MIQVQRLKRFWDFFESSKDKRFIVVYGGSGSGKSVAVAMRICYLFVTYANLNILVTMKTTPSLRLTAYPLIRGMLMSWNIPFTENISNGTISYKGSVIYFKSIDDPEKIKSFNASIIWMEEATSFEVGDKRICNNTLRKPGVILNQLFMSFNPIDVNNWAVQEYVTRKPDDAAVMHSTYMDNPFLNEAYVKQLEGYEKMDKNFYKVYTLGEPGVLEGKVYTHYKVQKRDLWPQIIREKPPHFYGLDWGYNHPMVLMAIWQYEKEYYWHEILHAKGQTNPDLIRFMNEKKVDKQTPIACDPSGADSIEELIRAGYNAVKADNSVKEGIKYVKAYPLIISEESPNTIKEMNNYKFKEMPMLGPDGEAMYYEEPVKAFDDGPDAGRYGEYTFRPRDPEGAEAIDVPFLEANNMHGFGTGDKSDYPWLK